MYKRQVRGHGGQNSIGPERGDDLGYIRSEELFHAMGVFGADIGWLSETIEAYFHSSFLEKTVKIRLKVYDLNILSEI